MKRAFSTALLLALVAARPAFATETYTVTPIPVLPGDESNTVAGVNANGQVAGYSTPSHHGLLWQQGIVTTVPPLPGADGMNIRDLTDDGRLLGSTYGPGLSIAFVFDHGTLTPLLPTGGADLGDASGINRFGLVCGWTMVDGNPTATVWEGFNPSLLPAPAGSAGSFASCLNDAGVVAGTLLDSEIFALRLALWTNGVLEDHGAWPGVPLIFPLAINESNVVIGVAQPESGEEFPFRWENGTFEALPLLPGCDGGTAYDINEKGQIVGVLTNPDTFQVFGVIWEDGVPYDVETLFEPGAAFDVEVLQSINDRGQIAGQGWLEPGVTRIVLLTPRVDALAGNVNVQNGPPANVLLVNGSSGDDADRTITLARNASIQVTMDLPPAMPGTAGFALYVFAKAPNASTVTALPLGLGDSAMPMPPSGPGAHPLRIWNNLGKVAVLGSPDFPSSPAPSTVLNRPSGLGKVGTFTFQGIIRDTAAPNGVAAITNGVVVQSN